MMSYKDTPNPKFWASLRTSTKNALARHFAARDTPLYDTQPWEMSVKELVRIPGIGPQAVAEIAKLTEKYCV